MTTIVPGSVKSTQWLPLGTVCAAGAAISWGGCLGTSFNVLAGAMIFCLISLLPSAACGRTKHSSNHLVDTQR